MQEGEYASAQHLVDQRLEQDVSDDVRRTLLDLAADAAYRLGDLNAAEVYCKHPALSGIDPRKDASLNIRNTLRKVRLFLKKILTPQVPIPRKPIRSSNPRAQSLIRARH